MQLPIPSSGEIIKQNEITSSSSEEVRTFCYKIQIMTKEVFQRTKPMINIGTIGHADHGKTTLSAAICTILAKYDLATKRDPESFDSAPAERALGCTISPSHVTYETLQRVYTHIDCPGHAHYMKSMSKGAAQMDAAILVVSAYDGPMDQTRESLILARQAGISNIVVFLSKCDMVTEHELRELVEDETRELLSEYDFDGDKVPVIQGSALKALEGKQEWEYSIIQLLQALDSHIPIPKRSIDQPFLMPITHVYSIPDHGTVVTGRIERGVISVGDQIDIVGINDTILATCSSLEFFRKLVQDECRAGENVGILLRGIRSDQVRQGQVLAAPNSVTSHHKFVGEVNILTNHDGGRCTHFSSGYMPQFFFRSQYVTGKITTPEGVDFVEPGDHVSLQVELITSIPMEEGLHFSIRGGQRTVGVGIISKII